MKYRILNVLDVAGLKVLEPVVRLGFGEEPRQQLREIGLFIVVPIIVFCVFLGAWTIVAPRHKTKSGEVPTPAVVVDAYGGIVEFHNREYTKLTDFTRSGDERDQQLAAAKARMSELTALAVKVDREFAKLELGRLQQFHWPQRSSVFRSADRRPALRSYRRWCLFD